MDTIDTSVPIIDRPDAPCGRKPVTRDEWNTAKRHGYTSGDTRRGTARMLTNGGAAGSILVPVVVLKVTP